MPFTPPSLYVFVMLLLFIIFGIYVQFHSIPIETRVTLEHRYHRKTVILPNPTTKEFIIPSACQHADFHWLVNDRDYWDGWESKSMFLRQDGRFTRNNVEIEQGETVCIAVLLGPTPALGAIEAVHHFAPSDVIVMTATNKERDIKLPIKLHQHQSSTHVYFAQVQFTHHGTYSLDTSVEYRSYFWEFPGYHPYRPNRFVSKNQLIVRPKNIIQLPCLTPGALKDSVWKNHSDGEWRFVPRCRLVQGCDFPPNIHVWGDDLVRRNIDVLIGKEERTICDDFNNVTLVEKIAYGDNTFIHFGLMNKAVGENYNEWKELIYQKMTINKMQATADVVILAIGNVDLYKSRQSPIEFARGFVLFIKYVMQMYTEEQVFVVKTTTWTSDKYSGKSEAYANVIRAVVESLNNDRILLWDTHQFGMKESALSDYAFELENSMLARLFCQLPQRTI